jgi:hypothetical protein
MMMITMWMFERLEAATSTASLEMHTTARCLASSARCNERMECRVLQYIATGFLYPGVDCHSNHHSATTIILSVFC